MPITITITANDRDEFFQLLRVFTDKPPQTIPLDTAPGPYVEDYDAAPTKPEQEPREAPTAEDYVESVAEAKKPRQRPSRAKVKPEPEPIELEGEQVGEIEAEPEVEPETQQMVWEDPGDEAKPEPDDTPAMSSKELLDLKARMLTKLQAAIAEGKINKLRALLAEHGGGAKSFPEVAPADFLVIEQALLNGALA